MCTYGDNKRYNQFSRLLKDKFGADTHVGIHVEPIKKDGRYAEECKHCVCHK